MNYTDLIAQLDALTLGEVETGTKQAEGRVCYVFDEEMTQHVGGPEHPERPDRIRTINEHLLRAGLLKPETTVVLPSRLATTEELCLAHTKELVDQILAFEHDERFTEASELVTAKRYIFPFDSDTYICHATPRAAQLACGSVLNCVDRVCEFDRFGFCAIRPPGHHASADKASGYCLFNNVAVAAKYATAKRGLSRVAILDWDVHHGNGTQAIFENDPNVLFLSVHRHDGGKFYPGTGHFSSSHSRCINMSIDGSFGDPELEYVFEHVILPSLANFKPELLLVSAGFDAAENDPLGGCRVRTETYGRLTRRLIEMLSPKSSLLLVLEGGYNLDSIAEASVACMRALIGSSLSPALSPVLSCLSSPSSSVRSVGPEMVKSNVVRMVHFLSKQLGSIRVAPKMVPRRPAPRVRPDEFLTSGGGHVEAVVRIDSQHISKNTTQREALVYCLIGEASGQEVEIKEGKQKMSLATEKKRIGFEAKKLEFKNLKQFVCDCHRVEFLEGEKAVVILQDLTRQSDGWELIGVLDLKLGTEYHTPEDAPDRVQTRRQKALNTSADTLGVRLTAGRMADGFTLAKRTAVKLKTLEKMSPVIRRFLMECVDSEAKSSLIDSSCEWIANMQESVKGFRFIAASVLMVMAKNIVTGEMKITCKLIDLAHMFPPDENNGFALGCENFILLLQQAKDM